MRPVLVGFTALLALAPVPARAQSPSPASLPTLALSLEYTLGPGAERCPGEELLHRELARRVGYDPFVPSAFATPAGRVRAVIAREARGLTATYEYLEVTGARRWLRTSPVDGASTRACEEAIKDMAVDLQVEFPLFRRPSLPSPARSPPEPEPIAVAAIAPAPPRVAALPAPAPASSPRPRLELGGGAFVAFGVAPTSTFGGAVHLGVEVSPFGPDRPWLSFAVEGRADAPGSSGPGGIHTRLLAGSALACGHEALFHASAGVTVAALACVLGTAGRVHTSSEGVDRSLSLSSSYAGLGPRFGVEMRLGSLVAIRAQGDILPTIHPASAIVDGHGESWSTSEVSGNAGLALLLFF